MLAYEMANDADVKPLLMAKGATAAQIYKLKTDAYAIIKAVKAQSKAKNVRSTSAQNRIINLNKVWARMVMLSGCAKEIYKDNHAMWNLFLLYK